MGNRRLYGTKTFQVAGVERNVTGGIWHIHGKFAQGSIKSKYANQEYRIRVTPDPRFDGVTTLAFRVDAIYECESIRYASRRHVYGSGNWYISPEREKPGRPAKGEFAFEDFETPQSMTEA